MPYPDSDAYHIEAPDQIFSPGLVVFQHLLEHNLDEMVRVAGGPERLRPHCKTHKTPQVIRQLLDRGVEKHKCATLAEAEMLARAGVVDILVAYPMVGPNLQRFVQLVDRFPAVDFMTLVDCPANVNQLSAALLDQIPAGGRRNVGAMLDLNPGMDRTGIETGPQAIELYEMIEASEGLDVAGLHWYDGHHRQSDRQERSVAVNAGWDRLTRFRDQLMLTGLPVPRLVAAGTGSFPILAEHAEPNLQLSPGTTVYFDDDMATRFPELDLFPAIAILTRVIGNPQAGHLTLDVGHKACAADQPQGARLAFPDIPDAIEVLHSEEHLVIRTASARSYPVGTPLIAIPRHACPVSAVYAFADVIDRGKQVDRWPIVARDRFLTI